MQEYKSGGWSVAVPPEWEIVTEDDAVTFFNPKGFGEFSITAVRQSEKITRNFLEHLAEDHLEEGAEAFDLEAGDFNGFELSYEDEGELVSEWYLACADLALFATYACEVDDEGLEEEYIDDMLASLEFIAE